jgi:hypothetical protein
MAKAKDQAGAKPDETQDQAGAKPDEVVMEKDGVRTEVRNNGSVEVMEQAGWKLV